MLLSVVCMPLFWGEEFGWTGYLRPRLLPGNQLMSLLATSFVWAAWHYPLAWTDYAEFDNVLVGLLCWTAIFFRCRPSSPLSTTAAAASGYRAWPTPGTTSCSGRSPGC